MKKKIVVKGPALSASGYGEQTRFALRSLREQEDSLEIFLININWGRTGQAPISSDEKAWLEHLITKTQAYAKQNNNRLHFDISLQITIPNEFEKMAEVNIGYTAGIETTKVAHQWIEKCNMMDKIIVPSNHSKNVLEQTVYKAKHEGSEETFDFKLTTPVEVCAFPASESSFVVPELNLESEWNFLSVAQWGLRKNVEATVRNFLEEFKNEEDVGLILKLNVVKNSMMDKLTTQNRLRQVVEQVKAKIGDYKCKLYLLHGSLSDEEMRGLYRHPKIKAFVTTTHGEGFGLPMFDAAIAGLPIAAPAWSSYVDFLYAPKKDKQSGKIKNQPHFVRVDYELKPVQKEAVWDGVIVADSQWCWVKDYSVRDSMRELRKNYGPHLSDAKKLSAHVLTEFTENKQKSLMVQLITGEKIETISIEEIPKITVITSLFKSDDYIEQFLEDITSQTIFKEKVQLILVNPNPTIKEEKTILKYGERFPGNIVYRPIDSDPGIYGCWNMAIKNASGEFITNANVDDRKSPDFLEILAKALVSNKNIDVVYADNLITHNPNETWQNNTAKQIYPSEEFSLDAMLRGNPPHCMPMWRKSVHEDNGYFSEEYRSASDWEFWLRCAFNGVEMKKVNKILGLYYFNPKGMSTNKEHDDWKRKEEREIFKKYINLFQNRAA